ncbi:meteorin [Colletes latitarsis]|uniref:meteorin n=1 Tax=Colletes latitarsis TaxID=2605962 RepID=UPI0040359827
MRTLRFVACLVLLPSLLLRISIVSSAPTYEHAAFQAADQCDWIGSGGGGRGVRPVYLRCSRGTVSWRYPRGALRVVLSPPVLTGSVSKGHFELVEKRGNDGNVSTSDVYRLSGFRTCTKVSGPVRVYLETRGKLRSVYSPRDGKHEATHRCFRAKKQPAALYIEAEEPPVSGERRDAKLQYDLELRYPDSGREGRTRRFNEEEEEDCRPCSMDELAKAYCQSDLVARGTVSAVQRQPNLEAAELVLGITKTLRRIEENEGNNDADVTDLYDRRNIRVRVPTACDARHGQGEFVIMAKRRLGDLVLVCAPRLETWVKTVRELESAPCVLRS